MKKLLSSPRLYLIDYFDDLKTRINIEFKKQIHANQDAQSQDETNKHWLKLLHLIEKYQIECLNNTKLSHQTINDAKHQLNQIKCNKNKFDELLKVKHSLESHLLTNQTNLAILIPNYVTNEQVVLLVEEGFTQIEIEW